MNTPKPHEIWFFGDSRVMSTDELVYWFPEAFTVADLTECGRYIAGKHIRSGYKFVRVTIGELVKIWLETGWGDVRLRASNNGWYLNFEEYKVRTVLDLAKTLGIA